MSPATPQLVAVVAMTNNHVIGKDGSIPWHLPADMHHFKQMTMAKPCVMSRKVWDSLYVRPLPGRENIVLTRQPGFVAVGAQVAHSPQQALALAGEAREVAIIGGAEIYALYWSQLSRLELTIIDTQLQGDTFFPTFPAAHEADQWQLTAEKRRPADDRNAYALKFQTWQRK